MYGKSNMETYITICKIDSHQEFAVWFVAQGKESASRARDLGSIPGSGRSHGEGNGNPLQYLCLEKSHGQRSLVGCSSWGRKESGMTGQLTLHFRKLKQGLCINLQGWMGREMEGRFKRERTYVYLRLIHVEDWQKTTKFCKAIILQ